MNFNLIANRHTRRANLCSPTVRIIEEINLIDVGGCKSSSEVSGAVEEIRQAIRALVWPSGADRFIIHPQSGKKSGEGNGVRPIRDAFVLALEEQGWDSEVRFPVITDSTMADFGKLDASKHVFGKPFVAEWETGNISSSHRAMNKMSVGLIEGKISAGVLVVPSKALARFLTDRIGNIWELRPYFPLWRSIVVSSGYLGIIVVEHDDESENVPRIKKGTDGRALR